MSTTGILSLTEWQRQTGKNPSSANLAWLRRDDCIHGRGGALFIGLHNRRLDASVNILFQQLEIVRNSAVVGGKKPVEEVLNKSALALS